MKDVVLTGTGVYAPTDVISNQELVDSFNAYVDAFNEENKRAIEQGQMVALAYSDAGFIEKASGIQSRHVIDKVGVLDPLIMHPIIENRPDEQLSYQAEFAVKAAERALLTAHLTSSQIDAVICACSNLQRPYPAIAIEVQHALAISGFAFDMNVACSSATFALQLAENLIKAGSAKNVLIVNPEICSAHLNFRDRDSHFIFGDVATAMVLQEATVVEASQGFKVVSSKTFTTFSNNIRNNGGFMNRLTPESSNQNDKLFYQNGRKVFKEVTGQVVTHVSSHLAEHELTVTDLSRLWLHQANLNMNRLIASKLLNKEADETLAPVILDRYANTASAGSVIAFDHYHQDLKSSQLGLLCSFGAGYSIGSVILEKR